MNSGDEKWAVEDVEVAKPVAVVLSVRVPKDLAEQFYTEAERRGVRASSLLREAIEMYLDQGAVRAATIDLTISSADAPITLYTGGRSSQGRTSSAPSSFEAAGAGR